MDGVMPADAGFKRHVFLEHAAALQEEDAAPFLSPYPIMIKCTATDPLPRYQVVTLSSRMTFVGEESDTGRSHWFYAIWFLVLYVQKEYSGYLG